MDIHRTTEGSNETVEMANITNIDEEFKKSFSHAMLVDKLAKTAIEYITNTNPIEVILNHVEEEDNSEVKERVKVQMQEWMGSFEDTLKAGRTVPVDLIGFAADITKQRRKSI